MEKYRVAVTGINGFVGHHLARELHKNNIFVIGIGHDSTIADEIKDIVDEYHSADLTKSWPQINNLKAVIHLAGLAAVGPSYDAPQRYIETNSAMVTNMCEYYIAVKQSPRIIIVSSGAVYDPNQSMPILESSTIGYTSPYAVSKVLTENQAKYYTNRGIECIVARPFNHIGPGQKTGFILPDFYSRLKNLNKNDNTISVGNIKTRRDYTDVRDIVSAYRLLATSKTLNHSVYNICSGKSLSGVEIFDTLKEVMNMPEINFVIDEAMVRPTDIPEIFGDASRLQNELGWRPEYTIDTTIKDFVNS